MRENEINIENYEAWLVDYADGNLSEDQTYALVVFMKQHPELSDDFELAFEPLPNLEADDLTFDFKHNLKQPESVLDVDDLIIGSVEGINSKEEELELQNLISQHVTVKRDYELVKLTKLPAEEIIFEEKDQLKRTLVIPFHQKYRWQIGIAASLLFLFGLFTFLPTAERTNSALVAENNQVEESNKNSTDSNKQIKINKEKPVQSIEQEPSTSKQEVATPKTVNEKLNQTELLANNDKGTNSNSVKNEVDDVVRINPLPVYPITTSQEFRSTIQGEMMAIIEDTIPFSKPLPSTNDFPTVGEYLAEKSTETLEQIASSAKGFLNNRLGTSFEFKEDKETGKNQLVAIHSPIIDYKK